MYNLTLALGFLATLSTEQQSPLLPLLSSLQRVETDFEHGKRVSSNYKTRDGSGTPSSYFYGDRPNIDADAGFQHV